MYKLNDSIFITRIADGANIPPDPANSDYSAYLRWLNGWTEIIRAPGTWTTEVPATFDEEGNELTPAIPGYWTEGAVLETIVHPPHTPEPYVPPPVDLRAVAKAAREKAVSEIKVTTQAGNTFDGDETSQGRMSRAIIALSTGLAPSVNWVLADNSVIRATAAELTEALVLAGQAQAAIWVIP